MQRTAIINDSLGIAENIEVADNENQKQQYQTQVSKVLEEEGEDDDLEDDVMPDMSMNEHRSSDMPEDEMLFSFNRDDQKDILS